MSNHVIIKGKNDRLVIALNPDIDFFDLCDILKTKILEAKDFIGNSRMAIEFSGRALTNEEENKLAKEMITLERSGTPKEEIEKLGTGSLKLAVVNGDVERGSFMSGQVAAMVNDEKTTKEILEFLMYDLKLETEVLKRRLENWDI